MSAAALATERQFRRARKFLYAGCAEFRSTRYSLFLECGNWYRCQRYRKSSAARRLGWNGLIVYRDQRVILRARFACPKGK
jgi:hypothetical protein